MKKITYLFIVLCTIGIGVNKISAKVPTIDQIIEKVSNEDCKITKTESGFIISYIIEDPSGNINYTMPITYKDNIISFTNTRDLSNMNEGEKFIYSTMDLAMFYSLITSAFDLYDYDYDSSILFNSENYYVYGISYVDGGYVNFNNSGETTDVNKTLDLDINIDVSVDASATIATTKSFSIDLVKMEEAINNAKNSTENKVSDDSNQIDTLEQEVKVENPKTGSILDYRIIIPIIVLFGLLLVGTFRYDKFPKVK